MIKTKTWYKVLKFSIKTTVIIWIICTTCPDAVKLLGDTAKEGAQAVLHWMGGELWEGFVTRGQQTPDAQQGQFMGGLFGGMLGNDSPRVTGNSPQGNIKVDEHIQNFLDRGHSHATENSDATQKLRDWIRDVLKIGSVPTSQLDMNHQVLRELNDSGATVGGTNVSTFLKEGLSSNNVDVRKASEELLKYGKVRLEVK